MTRVEVLGVPISAIDLNTARSTIENWISARSANYVCVCGAHGIIECQQDAELLGIHKRAGMVTPDGMPVVWMCRALGQKQTSRVYGPDLMRLMSRVSAAQGYKQFYYGGNPGVADRLADKLAKIYKGLSVVGTYSPPFRPLTLEEDEAIVRKINEAKPDIVWVGLSTPKQERWMASHIGRLNAPVIIGVGAAFDFLAGTKKQAPKWMQSTGLEWLYRLAQEPRRLGSRYALIVPLFSYLSLRQLGQRYVISRSSPLH